MFINAEGICEGMSLVATASLEFVRIKWNLQAPILPWSEPLNSAFS